MEGSLISKADAQVLTVRGFYKHWRRRLTAGVTRAEAYYQTEALHRDIHELGVNKYAEFLSFDRLARKMEAEAKQRYSPAALKKNKKSPTR